MTKPSGLEEVLAKHWLSQEEAARKHWIANHPEIVSIQKQIDNISRPGFDPDPLKYMTEWNIYKNKVHPLLKQLMIKEEELLVRLVDVLKPAQFAASKT